MVCVAWYTLWIGLLHMRIYASFPWSVNGALVLGGFATPAFYRFSRQVTAPLHPPSAWPLAPGLLATLDAFLTAVIPGGFEFVITTISASGYPFHPILAPLFLLHVAAVLGFVGATTATHIFEA